MACTAGLTAARWRLSCRGRCSIGLDQCGRALARAYRVGSYALKTCTAATAAAAAAAMAKAKSAHAAYAAVPPPAAAATVTAPSEGPSFDEQETGAEPSEQTEVPLLEKEQDKRTA